MSAITVVISRSSDLDTERRSFEDALKISLHAAGCDVLLVPHLYYLQADDEAVNRLAHISNDLVVAAWLYPRAVRWTLHGLGIDEKRIATCHDLRMVSCSENAAEAILVAVDNKCSEAPSVDEMTQSVHDRWYPVIDYSRCVSCKQCFGFCLFGVYTVESDRVIASNADSCKHGCPACARVCPQGAILFPHCDDAAIAGEPGAQVLGSSDPVRAVIERARRKQNAASNGGGNPAQRPQADELDDLINALENLDD